MFNSWLRNLVRNQSSIPPLVSILELNGNIWFDEIRSCCYHTCVRVVLKLLDISRTFFQEENISSRAKNKLAGCVYEFQPFGDANIERDQSACLVAKVHEVTFNYRPFYNPIKHCHWQEHRRICRWQGHIRIISRQRRAMSRCYISSTSFRCVLFHGVKRHAVIDVSKGVFARIPRRYELIPHNDRSSNYSFTHPWWVWAALPLKIMPQRMEKNRFVVRPIFHVRRLVRNWW